MRLCNLRTRFLAKGQMGKSFRYVSRNGRILLAADMGISELVDSVVELRLQIWNRAILPGDKPDPFGFLLCVRSQAACSVLPLLSSKLVEAPSADGELSIDLGGRLWLEFCRASCQSAQTV
ncbi:MAG TPA: hypothetical protein VKI17_06600 [Gemmataceae bacterium]|nr:hypothetical protein [Gemmataceae bacterium]